VGTEKIAVIGAGSWGTVIAALLEANRTSAGEVVLWARGPAHAASMQRARRNERYSSEVELPAGLAVTSSLEEAVTGAGVAIMVVPSRWAREVLVAAAPFLGRDAVVVSLTKGIEPGTLLTMSQVIEEVVPGRAVAVLSGPNLAEEIARGLPAATVVASARPAVASALQRLFAFPRLRVYTNHDVVGCELAGSVKNVLALGAGMADGLGAGDDARAAIITRGLAELARLGTAMGGNPLTFSGLAGLGDLVLTCTSERSRNRKVGLALGSGQLLRDVLAGMKEVAEGVTTAASVVALAERQQVELPICQQVAAVLDGSATPAEAVAALLSRELTHELAGWPPRSLSLPMPPL
jgi:glycerol-3-phosphate dehydrogenase (NAD(P)+)